MKKHLLFSIFIFSIIFSSCDLSVGLGDAPDLEAPTLSITSPATLSNTSATPTISGVCSDNKAVSKITVYNTTSASYLENATISDGSWNWTGTLTEGYQTLRFTAYDANSNSSTDSVAQITIIVDVTSPESQNWYIERAAGITTLFTTKTALEAIDTDDSSNKDMAQNVSFIVHGKISDNMSLASVALNVYEG
ncbi:MAG: Ig-like domain-containing protein, partial [Treponema sp.]